MNKYENKFPSGIGFVNENVEVFVVRENLFGLLIYVGKPRGFGRFD